MKILVTGGNGFIGRHTVDLLLENNYSVISLDNLALSEKSKRENNQNFEFVQGDVLNFKLVDSLIEKCDGGVIHLAADSRVLPTLGSPEVAFRSIEVNTIGTLNILKSLLKHDRHLVYAGSSTAYGNRLSPQSELTPPDILSPYSAGKLSGEHFIRSFAITFGIKATVLRYFQVYGPGQPQSGPYALVTGIFLRQFLAGETLTVEGDGMQSRDLIHVRDVAKANLDALKVNSKGEPINIGSGTSISIIDLAKMYSDKITFLPARNIDLKATLADISLAKEILQWKPAIKIVDGISEMIRDAKK